MVRLNLWVFALCVVILGMHQTHNEPDDFYMTLEQGGLYRLDAETGSIALIYGFQREWENESLYWGKETFSPDGRYIGTIARHDNGTSIEVIEIESWTVLSFPIDMALLDTQIFLTWLPNSQNLLVSYWQSTQATSHNILKRRELIDLQTHQTSDFPFMCYELGVSQNQEAGLIFRSYDLELQMESHLEPSLYYLFRSGDFTLHNPNFDHVLTAFDCPYGRVSWDWSQMYGLIFSTTINDGDNGLFWLPSDPRGIVDVQTSIPQPQWLYWGADSSFVVISSDTLHWQVIDVRADHQPAYSLLKPP
ncbi:MAG: hypothetical protein U0670_02555 [Anaerolineae bacterium]